MVWQQTVQLRGREGDGVRNMSKCRQSRGKEGRACRRTALEASELPRRAAAKRIALLAPAALEVRSLPSRLPSVPVSLPPHQRHPPSAMSASPAPSSRTYVKMKSLNFPSMGKMTEACKPQLGFLKDTLEIRWDVEGKTTRLVLPRSNFKLRKVNDCLPA